MSSHCRRFPVLVSIAVLSLPLFCLAQKTASAPTLSTNEIVQKLMTSNLRRSRTLRGYEGKRTYHLTYSGIFGHHQADMVVQVTYSAPDKKDFRVLSQSGSSLLINRVLLRMLNSESEAQEEKNRKQLEVNSENYNFSLEGLQHAPSGDCYVLDVTPKGKSRYLYRGKIWVDAHDFAVARMEGEPQKNLSMWVSHTELAYTWLRQDGFWLPAHTDSASQVRMGGRVNLTIDYSDYQVNSGVRLANEHTPASDTALPSPSSITGDPR
jgi:outer membrane lipoprotein-sorting protein